MATLLKHRHGSKVQWESWNPIILDGEIIVIYDGLATYCKCGDGKRTYDNLPYMMVSDGESARIAAEQIRIENENLRISNETTRNESESARIMRENQRIENENLRISKENKRIYDETTRINSELGRLDAERDRKLEYSTIISQLVGEEQRVTNETTRESNEATRESNERGRLSDEGARSESETARVSNENIRSNNEITRLSSETTRVSNENIRVSNELVRQTHYTKTVFSSTGIHGMRYYNEELQYLNGSIWTTISTGAGGIPFTIGTNANGENCVLEKYELAVGSVVCVMFNGTPGTTIKPSININNTGIKYITSIVYNGVDTAGWLKANHPFLLYYNGISYVCINPLRPDLSLNTHNHDGTYALITHNHTDTYASMNHNHNTVYASKTHSHNISDISDFPTDLLHSTDIYDWAKSPNKPVYTAFDVGAAPSDHASENSNYGAGNGVKYGHVKLSDSFTDTSNASTGVAATPAAVKAAYDLANNAKTIADSALNSTGGILTGNLVANAGTDINVRKIRNIIVSRTYAPTSSNGDIIAIF